MQIVVASGHARLRQSCFRLRACQFSAAATEIKQRQEEVEQQQEQQQLAPSFQPRFL